jgi:antitoxin component YwqK of YwqJK toxin-antitoxin module
MGYENNELIAKFLLSDPLEDGKFIDGTMNGKWQDTIQNDNSRELHHYTNDEGYYMVPHSVWVHNYKDGVKDGEQLRIRVHDENEKWDGTQQILEKQNYKNGQKHGKHLKYESGRLKVEELYDNSTKIEEIKYHDNGKVNKLTKYQNKPPYKEEFIYEDNGYLVWYSQEYKSGYSKVKEYNLGNLTREFMMVGGKKEGKEIEYYPNGNKKTIFTLINGQFSGLYETYYENGNLKTRGNIENDIFVDTFEEFYPSGNLKKRDYLQNGRPIKTENFEDK